MGREEGFVKRVERKREGLALPVPEEEAVAGEVQASPQGEEQDLTLGGTPRVPPAFISMYYEALETSAGSEVPINLEDRWDDHFVACGVGALEQLDF